MTLKNLSLNGWIADTRASTHMIGNLGMLKNLCHYFGSDAVIIGDNSTHAIIHIVDIDINNGTNKIKLNDLLVPALAKNILSIGHFTNDYLYNCNFYGVGFIINGRPTTS